MKIKIIKKAVLTTLITFAAIAFISCQFTVPYHITESPVLQITEAHDIIVECLYLDRGAIEARHGYKDNPFFAPCLCFTPQYMIIFELKITNNDSAPVKIDNREISFYFNDKRYRPMSTVDMEAIIDEYSEKRSRIKENRIARAYMFPNIKTIPGNSSETGYLVFLGGFKDKGEGELVLNFKSENNLEAGEFTFDYNFRLTK